MWLIISWWAAILTTAAYIYSKNPKTYRLDWLCLMLWGLTVMVLVDHVIGFITDGGEFIEVSTEGYIENGALLGITMLIPIFLIWEIGALVSKRKTQVSESLEKR
ncbi:MAG: hypothetical protein FGF52_06300 [Candidatus Brockarchaeota archaeon]|nr:hypothetical protein [Candidatus Brockarchaeota archaeon]